MLDRLTFHIGERLGWLLCELAFRCECRGPFAGAYRAGCRIYRIADDAGIRCGELVENPNYRPGCDQPMYVDRSR
jgi:hypothetical protein